MCCWRSDGAAKTLSLADQLFVLDRRDHEASLFTGLIQ